MDIARQVLTAGVALCEGWQLIQVLMVKLADDAVTQSLQFGEVQQHSMFVEFLSRDSELDAVVVTVQPGAGAGMAAHLMSGGELAFDGKLVHALPLRGLAFAVPDRWAALRDYSTARQRAATSGGSNVSAVNASACESEQNALCFRCRAVWGEWRWLT